MNKFIKSLSILSLYRFRIPMNNCNIGRYQKCINIQIHTKQSKEVIFYAKGNIIACNVNLHSEIPEYTRRHRTLGSKYVIAETKFEVFYKFSGKTLTLYCISNHI